jgi:hypothetical protein
VLRPQQAAPLVTTVLLEQPQPLPNAKLVDTAQLMLRWNSNVNMVHTLLLLELPLAQLPPRVTTLTTRARALSLLAMLTIIVRLALLLQLSVHLVLSTLVVPLNRVIALTSPLVNTELVHLSLVPSLMVTSQVRRVSTTQSQLVAELSVQWVPSALAVLRLTVQLVLVVRTRRPTKMSRLVLTSAMLAITVSVEPTVDAQPT